MRREVTTQVLTIELINTVDCHGEGARLIVPTVPEGLSIEIHEIVGKMGRTSATCDVVRCRRGEHEH